MLAEVGFFPPLPILGLLNQRQGLGWVGHGVVLDSKHKKGTTLPPCLQQPTPAPHHLAAQLVDGQQSQWPVMVKFQKEEKG